MIGLLGKKIGMSQIFDAEGHQVPVTVLEVGPCYVTGLRTKEKNGYSGVQLAFDQVKAKRLNKAKLGILKKANAPTLNFIREIRTEDITNLSVGSELRAENFEAGEYVDIEGISIGKGFQGVVKRLNYRGGGAGHGSMFGRVPGGIGSRAGGVGCRKKVSKGKGLPGHMGDEKICIHNLKVMKVDAENNLMALSGSVPGAEGGYLIIRRSFKRGNKNSSWKVRNSKQESPKETPSETAQAEKPQEAAKSKS